MTRALVSQGIVAVLCASLAIASHAAVPAGTQLPLKAVDKQLFKTGAASQKARFRITPDDPADTQSIAGRLAGCTIEGDAALNPRSGRIYVKNPVLSCSPETKMGAAFLGGNIVGQLTEGGLDGMPIDCPKPKECAIGSVKKDADVSFTVTETMGGGE